jgi:hypothetical protein
MEQPAHFLLKFENIPLINLRMEFNRTYAFIHSQEADTCLKPPIEPVRAPMFIWGGMPDDLMTLLLQRAILGVEAYLPGALIHTSAILGNLSSTLSAKLKNPFAFGARSAVANIYHHAPASVHPELSLRHLDEDLYQRTVQFYRLVRNPIFHGKQIHDADISHVRNAFDHVARIYEWIDYWYNPEKLVKGGAAFAGVRARHSVSPQSNDAP